MNQDTTFSYSYSAKQNREVQEIRKKYLPQSESKLDELKRLDSLVQSAGIAEALCAGIGGLLIFGVGICFAMQVIADGAFFIAVGVLIGIIGMVCMLFAYPVYQIIFDKTKHRYTARILELAEELTGEKNDTL